MSFGNMRVFGRLQEALILALMLVSVLAIFYIDMDFSLRIGIGVIVFAVVFLATLAAGLLRQQREIQQAQA